MADRKDIGGEDAPLNIMKETIMRAVLKEGPTPKKNKSPMIVPFVREFQPDDVLAKGKGVQGDVDSSSTLEESILRVAVLDPHIADLICRHVAYLESEDGSCRGLQHQPKDLEYAQKIKKFIRDHEESSSDEVLSKERNCVFLWQLLEDILDSQESSLQEKVGISPDPALAALGAAPSCHRRANVDELFAPIPYQW